MKDSRIHSKVTDIIETIASHENMGAKYYVDELDKYFHTDIDEIMDNVDYFEKVKDVYSTYYLICHNDLKVKIYI